MNPFLFKSIVAAFSMQKELKYVAFTFLLVLLIPIIAVILLTHAGIDIISDRLATFNEEAQTVQIRDPLTGEVIKEIQAAAVWPARGVVTLEFGQSNLPFQLLHSGIDIANPYGQIGDPVTAFMPGKVIYEGQIFWGFGKHIIIDHGDDIMSIYAHLDKIFVVKGQEITTSNQVIGLEGDTGWATGPHLHFQINVFGVPVNPRTFLQGNP